MKLSVLKTAVLWGLMALPGAAMLTQFFGNTWSEDVYNSLMHGSGEMAIRITLLALLVSPCRCLFPNNRFWKWMLPHRRHIGVAAFGYALLHTLFYFRENNKLGLVINDLSEWTYLFGWASFLLYVPLAITSANWAVKKMGYRQWKFLQRFVYVAIGLGFTHWMLKPDDNPLRPILVHLIPLLVLELLRIYKTIKLNK